MKLSEFLLARIAEDEAAARMAGDMRMWKDDMGRGWVAPPSGARIELPGRADMEPVVGLWLNHIARHDPARVLAECDAKRRIVAEFDRLGSMSVTTQPDAGASAMAIMDGLEIAIRALALPYADYPDYDEAWRP